MDDVDQKILALLVADGRRTYDDIAAHVSLSGPSVKRRVDRLRSDGTLRGFTAVLDDVAMGWGTEALVELFYAPGTLLDEVAGRLSRVPEVVEAWIDHRRGRRDRTRAHARQRRPRARDHGPAARRRARAHALTGRDVAAGQPLSPRWTSPASSAVWPPSGSRTTRRPAPSMPSATPEPPLQLTSRPWSAIARAVGRQQRRRSSASVRSSAASERDQDGLDARSGSRPSVAAVACSSGGRSSTRSATLRPMPSTAQLLLRAALGEDAGDFAPVDQDVIGPLDAARRRRRPRRPRRRPRAAAAAAGRAGSRTSAARGRAAPTRCGPGGRARRSARRR